MTQKMGLSEFQMIRTLGVGSFGRVKYAKWKDGNFYAVKFMKKHDIIKLKQVDHINGERNLMSKIQFPFIVCMLGSFKDERYVYIVMECIGGGELFTHLRRARKFTDEQSKFYGALTGAAFEHIHSKNIIHRDLKPENLLMCSDGYSKLTDFGFAKVVEPGSRTYTLCGTPEYMSPELIGRKGHNNAIDFWSLGILIFEMLSGMPPFYDDNPMITYTKIFNGKIDWPKTINSTAKDLVRRLLSDLPHLRLGCLSGGTQDIKQHAWFSGFAFDKLVEYQIEAPWKPKLKGQKEAELTTAGEEGDALGEAKVALKGAEGVGPDPAGNCGWALMKTNGGKTRFETSAEKRKAEIEGLLQAKDFLSEEKGI